MADVCLKVLIESKMPPSEVAIVDLDFLEILFFTELLRPSLELVFREFRTVFFKNQFSRLPKQSH